MIEARDSDQPATPWNPENYIAVRLLAYLSRSLTTACWMAPAAWILNGCRLELEE